MNIDDDKTKAIRTHKKPLVSDRKKIKSINNNEYVNAFYVIFSFITFIHDNPLKNILFAFTAHVTNE